MFWLLLTFPVWHMPIANGFCLTTDAQSFLTYLKLGFVYATTGRNVTVTKLDFGGTVVFCCTVTSVTDLDGVLRSISATTND